MVTMASIGAMYRLRNQDLVGALNMLHISYFMEYETHWPNSTKSEHGAASVLLA
jgi:hypothetical protein